jgi:hypothetical protein
LRLKKLLGDFRLGLQDYFDDCKPMQRSVRGRQALGLEMRSSTARARRIADLSRKRWKSAVVTTTTWGIESPPIADRLSPSPLHARRVTVQSSSFMWRLPWPE